MKEIALIMGKKTIPNKMFQWKRDGLMNIIEIWIKKMQCHLFQRYSAFMNKSTNIYRNIVGFGMALRAFPFCY